MSRELRRCEWSTSDELLVSYHDEEWGVPVHDENTLFELLTLEGAQAGLSWLTVLRRREGYRRLFEKFDAERVARFDVERIDSIMLDPSVVRHRQKVTSVVTNARAVLEVRAELGSFDRFIWGLVSVPGEGMLIAKSMSKVLVKRGFSFVGPTICLSFMQASGMVNDHDRDCFRYRPLEALRSLKT